VSSLQPSQRVEELTFLFTLKLEILNHIYYVGPWPTISFQMSLQISNNETLNPATLPCCIPQKNGNSFKHPLCLAS
jgi:hypothetical protein